MSFNKKAIYIILTLIFTAALVGCSGQNAAPAPTAVPATEAPVAPAAENAGETVKEAETAAEETAADTAEEAAAVSETIEETVEEAVTAAEETTAETAEEAAAVSETIEETVEEAITAAEETTAETAEEAAAVSETIEKTVEEAITALEETAADTAEEAAAVSETIEETVEEAVTAAEETAAETAEEAAAVSETIEETVEEAATAAEETAADTAEEAAAVSETIEETVEEAVTAAEETAAETVDEGETIEDNPAVSAETTDGKYAASVDGEGIPLDNFVQMTTFNRYQYLNMYYQYAQMYSMYGLPLDSLDEQLNAILGEEGKERLGVEAIDQLTYDKVLELEAKEAGLEITDQEVFDQLKSMFGYEDPSEEEEGPMGLDSFNVTLDATNSEEDKNDTFRKYAESVLDASYGGAVSFDYLKNYAKNILTDNKLFEKEVENRVFEAEMVSARHILVEDEETAKEIISKLDAGEDWAALASEHSLDTSNKDKKGDLGWFGRGEMVSEFEDAAFALEPGEISGPVKTSYGYHIIASDGKEIRPLTGSALESAKNAAYDEWAVSMRNKHDIQSYPEVWMDAVPMEPGFTSSASKSADTVEEPSAADADEETVEETEASAVETEADAPAEEAETVPAAVTEETEISDEEAETIPEQITEEAEVSEEVTEKAEAVSETVDAEAEIPAAETEETDTTAEETAEVSEEAVTSDNSETSPEQAEKPAAEAKAEIVAAVDDIEITADEFVQMATYNRYQILASYNQYVQYYSMFGISLDDVNAYYESSMGESGRSELGNSTIDQLSYFKMLDMEAEQQGIKVSDKDVIAYLKQMFGYENSETQAEESLGLDSFNLEADAGFNEDNDDDFRAFMEMDLGMAFNDQISFDFYLDYIRQGMIENAVVEKLLEDRVFEEEMVNARHILVEDENTAREILGKLDAGEDWNALASAYSMDTGNKDNGGTLGWFGRGVMVSEFEDAAFALEPGEISEPVKTTFGWHIIASDGKENRQMEDEALQSAQSAVYQEWYDELLKKHDLVSFPDVWMPLVPMQPAFEPIDIDTESVDASIPTFHIISEEDDEDSIIISEEDMADEEDLTIENTEQDTVAYMIDNSAELESEEPDETPAAESEVSEDDALTIENTEQDDGLTIDNTEQDDGVFTLSNEAENK